MAGSEDTFRKAQEPGSPPGGSVCEGRLLVPLLGHCARAAWEGGKGMSLVIILPLMVMVISIIIALLAYAPLLLPLSVAFLSESLVHTL